jgi:glycosyltransferase involved in cell wall biosynthesis
MTAEPNPRVSVLMTAYNRADYIGVAIESVLASTLQDFELLVVDDGSTDQTLEIAREIAARDPRVKVHANEKNLGDYPNRNHAASLARGEYLKYLDSDDYIYPHGLEVMVRIMDANPAAGVGLCAYAENSRPHPILYESAAAYRMHFSRVDLLSRAPGSAIIRREAFESLGGFTGRRQVGDHEFWLRLASRYPVVTMPRDLVWDRCHAAQEQNYDSPAEKTFMHQAVMLSALRAGGCPLSREERDGILRGLKRKRAKEVLRELLRFRFWEMVKLIRCWVAC